MRITDVEMIADRAQDARLLRVHTDEGIRGAYRSRIFAYASTPMPQTPKDAAEATRWAEAAFRAIKFGCGEVATACDGDVGLIRAIREAVGDDIEIMLDVGFNWEPSSAVACARRLEEYRPFWFENKGFSVWEGPLNDELTDPRFWIDENGDVEIPQMPGLGVTLCGEVIARYRR